MSDFVTNNVGGGGGRVGEYGGDLSQPSPQKRIFKLPGFVTLRRTHSMRHILERMSGNTMFWKWEEKKTHRETGDIFGEDKTEAEHGSRWVYFNCIS